MDRQRLISYARKKWQEMTITSDPMFGMVMENKEICLGLINRALPKLKARKIMHLVTQKDVNVVAAHRVRFDVFVQDDQNNTVVIEMQVNNRKNLPARLRYYQEQVDHSLLRAGADYRLLDKYPTYVIMFCDFDYFGRGWARYEFKMSCTRDHKLKFSDNRTIVVFNALAKEFKNDEKPIKDFLALMRDQGDNKDRFIAQIQREVDKVKQDPERRQGFMKYEMLMMDARREGLEEGRAEGLKKGHEKGRAEGIKIGEARVRDKGINTLIKNLQELNVNQSMIKQRVKDSYDLSDEELAKYFD